MFKGIRLEAVLLAILTAVVVIVVLSQTVTVDIFGSTEPAVAPVATEEAPAADAAEPTTEAEAEATEAAEATEEAGS